MNLNLEKYNRVFTFGCSFTNYRWPTWADILAEEIKPKPLYNYGMKGAGNLYIAHTISEADALHKFTEKDLVMVMWTNFHREDRFYKGEWLPAGNLWSQDYYPKDWYLLYDETHYLLRDLTLITFAKNFLENKKVDHHFMSMVPIIKGQAGETILNSQQEKIVSCYDTSYIRESIFELIFNNDWQSIKPRSISKHPDATHDIYGKGWYEDCHAHPLEYLEYLKKLWPATEFKKTTEEYASHWHKVVLETKDQYDELFTKQPIPRLYKL